MTIQQHELSAKGTAGRSMQVPLDPSEDTEGHGHNLPLDAESGDPEDTAGHGARIPLDTEQSEDTEGHGNRIPLDTEQSADEDTEGHSFRHG